MILLFPAPGRILLVYQSSKTDSMQQVIDFFKRLLLQTNGPRDGIVGTGLLFTAGYIF